MDKLKIYSAYLPYELKCEVINSGKEKEIGTLMGVYDDGSCVFGDIVESSKGFESVKPILFSLEDLSKEMKIQHLSNFPSFKPIEYISVSKQQSQRIMRRAANNQSLDCLEYWQFERLLELRFNVFNLPETEYIKVTEENNPYK